VATVSPTATKAAQTRTAPSTPAQTTPAQTTPAPPATQAQATAAAQRTAPSTPAQTTQAAPPASSASTAPASCHPLSNEGHCYEPGEFCRTGDHGTSGVAGDGEAIKCEDVNGWRWEPV
jgi:cytoskeletal protein RodZ